MKINNLLFILLCAITIPCIGQEKPNILFIYIDDMGYSDPSCFGNPLLQTPNIDSLAKNGLKLTNYYSVSPICSPSRTALLTGMYPMRFKIHSHIDDKKHDLERDMVDFLPDTVATLPKILQKNGYATGHFGKWHLGGGRDIAEVPYPSQYGFDKTFVSFEGIGDRVLEKNHPLSKRSAELGKGKIIWAEKYEKTKILVDSVISFIKSSNKPFYVNLFPGDVHDAHKPKQEDADRYKGVTNNTHQQKFLAVLEELDKQLGRLFTEMKTLGKYDNTIIVFTSDNGPADASLYYNNENFSTEPNIPVAPGFVGSLRGRKWSLYEGGIRMPFIIQWKGHVPKQKVDNMSVVSAIDIFPSLSNLLGYEYPKYLDGIDKSSVFLGNESENINAVMFEYGSAPGRYIFPGKTENVSPTLAIRKGKWKLLINHDGSQIELYDLINDVYETKNLAKENTDITNQLSKEVLEWRKSMPVKMGDISKREAVEYILKD